MLRALEPLAAEVFITAELARRTPRRTDHLREKLALQDLMARMVEQPGEVLPRFVDLAMQMTGGTSAGLSLYEDEPPPGVFRWHHLCGVTLDQAGPVLARHAERMYRWISDAGIVVPEVLLVPLYVGGQDPLGTLWIVSDEDGHFDRDHARLATELAAFVGIALRMEQTEQRLRQALEEQKTMTQEMGHRIKNLFAVVEGMVRFSARGAGSKDEMAQVLSGRLQTLASGYALAGRGRGDGDDVGASSLEETVRAIIQPHEGIGTGAARRFALRGPHVLCDGRAVNGLALALHELATNAIKYGALSTETGHVAIAWRRAGEELVLQWTERGGPTVAGPPTQEGFGGRLINSAVVHKLGGAVEYDWQADGLVVTIRASASNLKV